MRKVYFFIGLIILVTVMVSFALLSQFNKSNQPETIEINQTINTQVTQPTKKISNDECWDGVCSRKETYETCPQECAETCGDGIVQDNENWKNCRYDLLYTCGNGICESWEHYQYCSEDCEACIIDAVNKYSGEDECPPNPRWII